MALTYLQVGTWNIKHLGRQPTESEQSQSVYALTDHIEMAGVDVLALQEIYVTSTTGRRNSHLDKTCKLLREHTNAKWKYTILANRNRQDKSQLCGILWNDSIVNLKKRASIPVQFEVGEDWLWDRRPHAVQFETAHKILGRKRSFVLVPLHMKANGRDPRAKKKRELEAQQLADRIPWVIEKMGDESLILLGDTNILGAWEPAADILIEAGFNDLNSEDAPTYAGGRAPFDRFYLRGSRPEFQYSRQYVLRSANEDAHLGYLSDHYMIKTSIKVYLDVD